jgi:hypothetical protein
MFVLDEADEMLSRGFKDQIYDVFKYMPEDIQVIAECFYLTLSDPLQCDMHILSHHWTKFAYTELQGFHHIGG